MAKLISTYEEIISAALALPPSARAMLAEHLMESLDAEDQENIDALWAVERRGATGSWKMEQLRRFRAKKCSKGCNPARFAQAVMLILIIMLILSSNFSRRQEGHFTGLTGLA
jgi:hypothetical protein